MHQTRETLTSTRTAERVFRGDSETARLCRAQDWSRSSLGPVEDWPTALQVVVRTVLESAFPMCVWGGPEHLLIYNDAYRTVLGARHPDALGKPGLTVWQDHRTLIERLFAELHAGGPPFYAENAYFSLARAPGDPPSDAWFTWAMSAVRADSGEIVGLLNVASETTELQHAEQDADRLLVESEQARADADAASRTRSEFLATMSHEFRTPLNAILGYAQLLDLGVLGPATALQHAHLDRLQASARHLLQLVDDVLDVAKVDADRLSVRRDALALDTAVNGALALLQPQARAKGVRIVDAGGLGAGTRYVGDEHRVRQILVNLLSNAVKFSAPGSQVVIQTGAAGQPDPGAQPGGGARVGAEGAAYQALTGDAWVFVRVVDTGPGIPSSLTGRLFEPFVQGDSALTREKGGTGLGLAISRRLARLMGGDVTVRNQPGVGATFTLWLPREPETHAPGDAAPLQPPRTPTGVAVLPDADVDPPVPILDEAAYVFLHGIGLELAADAEHVANRYTAAIRADESFPGVRELPSVQIRNHATPAVGLLATQLTVIGETRETAAELLTDGAQLQRFMDELHGAQRYRLGWTEADIERETAILVTEVQRALTAAAARAGARCDEKLTALGLHDESARETSRQTALRYASQLARQILEQSSRTTLRAFRFAKSADTA